MPEGRGAVGAGHYPGACEGPHFGVAAVHGADHTSAGRGNMPAFGAKHAIGFVGPPATLRDDQIAAVINYVRTHFGNRYSDSITAAEVAALDGSSHQ